MAHAAVTLDYNNADWLRHKIRKSRKMIGTEEVKKKIWIGKIEAKKKKKKEKLGQMHFCPFIPVQSSYCIFGNFREAFIFAKLRICEVS